MSTERIDWSQLWYPGRRTPFTPDEMAQAGSDAPSRTLQAVGGINFAMLAFVVLQFAPPGQTARLTGLLVALGVLGAMAARWLWWRPWRRPLMHACLAIAAAMLLLGVGIRWRVPSREERLALAVAVAVGWSMLVVALWFLMVWRAQQIEGRLREQAERERAVEMARRLAAAQIEPHFLFNTLASLQHWVSVRDPRAETLLQSLTGYLRATLPMFRRAQHPLADELHAVRLYLQLMQLRLGERLRFEIDVPPALQAQAMPPGLLLTLVENALQHGVEPKLAGGTVRVSGGVDGDIAWFEVRDDGKGPPPDARDGVGLANSRERLALAGGPGAALRLAAHPEGGAVARVELAKRSLT
jgi:signal transduction histidine kinase